MKKIVLVFICLILLVGYGNSLYKDTEELVLNTTHVETKNTIINLVNELSMFPTEKDENTLITYILVIRDHRELFSDEEINDLKIILENSQYLYRLNSLGYTKEDIEKIIKEL